MKRQENTTQKPGNIVKKLNFKITCCCWGWSKTSFGAFWGSSTFGIFRCFFSIFQECFAFGLNAVSSFLPLFPPSILAVESWENLKFREWFRWSAHFFFNCNLAGKQRLRFLGLVFPLWFWSCKCLNSWRSLLASPDFGLFLYNFLSLLLRRELD